MDWHSWLSAARLEPALVYEYALVFARNELEAEDAAHFDHEFLQSMGVSVAKHRLEILKVARSNRSSPRTVARLLAAVDRTRRLVARYVVSLVHREQSSAAIVVVTRPDDRVSSKRGKALKRTKSKATAPKATGVQPVLAINRGAAAVHAVKDVEKGGGVVGEEADKMVRWDRMFQDMRPN